MKDHAPSAERNKSEILPVLEGILPTRGTILEVVNLTDTYDPAKLNFTSATPPPDHVDEVNGTLVWDDLTTTFGDLAPDNSIQVTLNFTAVNTTMTGIGDPDTHDDIDAGGEDENGVRVNASDRASVIVTGLPFIPPLVPSPPVGGTLISVSAFALIIPLLGRLTALILATLVAVKILKRANPLFSQIT